MSKENKTPTRLTTPVPNLLCDSAAGLSGNDEQTLGTLGSSVVSPLCSSPTESSPATVSPSMASPAGSQFDRPPASTPERAHRGSSSRVDNFLACLEVDKAYIGLILSRLYRQVLPLSSNHRKRLFAMDLRHADDCVSPYLLDTRYDGVPLSLRRETELELENIRAELLTLRSAGLTNAEFEFWARKDSRPKGVKPPTNGVGLSPVKEFPLK